MKPPTVTDLLAVWEHCLDLPLPQKALNLLQLTCSEAGRDVIAQLTIGQRDARLLLLREWMFGHRLVNVADCPKCRQRIEWETDIRDIRVQSAEQLESPGEFTLEADGFKIRFRLPTGANISAVIAAEPQQPDPAKLLTRCVLDTHFNDEACGLDSVPDHVLETLNRRMEAEDPQADILMAVSCPGCDYQWEIQFDIVSYFWAEFNDWARRMLRAVDKLAGAYGWSEDHILNMSPRRRQLYLEMAN